MNVRGSATNRKRQYCVDCIDCKTRISRIKRCQAVELRSQCRCHEVLPGVIVVFSAMNSDSIQSVA